jgi:hypothetical protein
LTSRKAFAMLADVAGLGRGLEDAIPRCGIVNDSGLRRRAPGNQSKVAPAA